MIDPEKLKKFLDILVKDPALKQKPDGTTFCNVGLHRSARLFEYLGFTNAKGEPIMAREMIAVIKKTGSNWLHCGGKQAADFALRGGFALSFMDFLPDPHDHVATVYPAKMEMSGSLKCEVPMVANIGKKNAVMKSSGAYPVDRGECRYAIYVG